MLRPWLSDAWSLLALALAQMFLTVVFVALVPYGYLTQREKSDEKVARNLQVLSDFAKAHAGQEVTWNELLDAHRPEIRQLLEALPCFWLVIAGSSIMYPFLGWWSGRWLHHPQLGGLLILGSIGTQQNIVMVPRNVEYLSVAPIALSLPAVMVAITFQFGLLTAGIMAQRGQKFVKSNNREKNDAD